MKSGISSGVRWTYFAALFNGLLQILMLAVMARLVDPRDFGILTTGLLIVKALQVLVQSGYERAVIWVDVLTEACEAGLFWTSLLTGLAITLSIMILARPLSNFFHEGDLRFALTLLSPMALLSAPGLVSRGKLRREMRFRSLAICDTLSYAIAFAIVGLSLALSGFGLWALVSANLVQSALQGGIPALFARHKWIKSFKLSDINKPLRFGYSVSLLGIVEFFDSQLTALYIGRTYGMTDLGIYNRSYALIQLPVEQLGSSLTRVLFSPFNRARGSIDDLRLAVQRPFGLLAMLVIPLALGGGAAAGTVIQVMLGNAWLECAPVFAALCVGTAAAVLGNLLATMNEALGVIRQKAAAQLMVTSILAVSLLLFGYLSLTYAAICFSLTRLLFLFAQIYIAAPRLGTTRLRLAAVLVPGVFSGIITALVITLASNVPEVANLSAWVRLLMFVLSASISSMVCAILMAPELRSTLKPLRNFLS